MPAKRESPLARVDRLIARRDWAGALSILDDEVRRQPGSFPLLRRRAEILESASEHERALEAYRHLAEVCISQGFFARAAAVRNKVARLEPEGPAVAEAIGRLMEERQKAEAASRPAVRRGRGGTSGEEARPVAERQAASEFLRTLPAEAVGPFLSATRPRRVRKDEVLFREGEDGATMFFIEEGTFEVTTHDPEGRTVLLGMLKPGEVVGEVSVLSERPRTATVIARQPALVREMDRDAFLEISPPHPEIREALESLLRRRARSTVEAMMRLRAGSDDGS